jgi:ComF family protein
MISGLLNKLYDIIQQAVFPPKCLVCNDFYRIPEHSRCGISANSGHDEAARPVSVRDQAEISLSACLCPDCLAELITVESPLCTCCGIPFKSRQGQDHYCGACIAAGKKFGIARAPLVYDRIITEVIHCFKYRGKIQLARPLSELLLLAFLNFWDRDGIDVILPVPLHPSRIRMRGFNQAYLLIRSWPNLAGQYSCDLSHIRIERDVLIRTVPTAPQSALDRTQRARNIKNAFDLDRQEVIVGKKILLIDDVYTTGATVNECGRLLLKRGARKVDVLTLARAV